MSKIRLSHNGNNIVLVGHMGSGKTSIGMNLSKKINYKFIDTDKEIEDESKMTIIFRHRPRRQHRSTISSMFLV